MPAKLFNDEIEQFIRDHVIGMYNEDLAELINNIFGTNYTAAQIGNYKVKNKLRGEVPKRKKGKSLLFSDKVQEFIKNNVKQVGTKELAEKINQEFGTNYTYNQIKAYKNRHKLTSDIDTKFKTGHIPSNKGQKGIYGKGCERTWFKKGHKPVNYKPVGSERVNVDGYIEVKIANPRTWKQKHRLIWEQHNGPIPKGCVVIFLDGDKTNTDISNLELITRAELQIVNQKKLLYNNAETTKTGIAIAKVLNAKNKRKKK